MPLKRCHAYQVIAASSKSSSWHESKGVMYLCGRINPIVLVQLGVEPLQYACPVEFFSANDGIRSSKDLPSCSFVSWEFDGLNRVLHGSTWIPSCAYHIVRLVLLIEVMQRQAKLLRKDTDKQVSQSIIRHN